MNRFTSWIPERQCLYYLLFISLYFNFSSRKVSGSCYLSSEILGEYLTQSLPSQSDSVLYSSVRIYADGIPIWGTCHEKMGQHVILKDRLINGDLCYRCLTLTFRSCRVLQILSSGLEQCYTEETKAKSSCFVSSVSENGNNMTTSSRSSKSQELLLFRIRDGNGGGNFPKVPCPFDGLFHFSSKKCFSSARILNCPQNHKLNFQLESSTNESCSLHFFSHENSRNFECLASWWKSPGKKHERYLLLEDLHYSPKEPKFRCLLYSADKRNSDFISLSWSRDSTCITDLFSSSHGFESFFLKRFHERPLPNLIRKSTCEFPSWLHGIWKQINFFPNSFTLRNIENYITMESTCIKQSSKNQNRYLIFTKTQCGEESYNCIWIESRGHHVFEFQLGLRPSTTPSFELCDNDHFLQRTWTTIPRDIDSFGSGSCPILGEYSGHLPDAPNLCAKLSSNCETPDIMYYSVADCDTPTLSLEEREYQCLAQWKENDVIYTHTKRRDINIYECFVGQVGSNNLSLMESGVNCRRGLRIRDYGMKLIKNKDCLSKPLSSNWLVSLSANESTILTDIPDVTSNLHFPIRGELNDFRHALSSSSSLDSSIISVFNYLFFFLLVVAVGGRHGDIL